MFVDSHCHLSDAILHSQLPDLLARARESGVQNFISVACDLADTAQILKFAGAQNIWATVGFHPAHALAWHDEAPREIEKLAADIRIVAVGEIGLDWVYDDQHPHIQGASRAFQCEVFEKQLEIAASLRLPIIIHNRDADDEILQRIAPWAPRLTGGVFHCFGGNISLARRVLDLGFHLGFGGLVTFKNAPLCHESARFCPLNRLLLETDAPYLAPHPHRGKTNQPAFVPLIAQRIAELKGISVEAVARQTTFNAFNLFPRLAPPDSIGKIPAFGT